MALDTIPKYETIPQKEMDGKYLRNLEITLIYLKDKRLKISSELKSLVAERKVYLRKNKDNEKLIKHLTLKEKIESRGQITSIIRTYDSQIELLEELLNSVKNEESAYFLKYELALKQAGRK